MYQRLGCLLHASLRHQHTLWRPRVIILSRIFVLWLPNAVLLDGYIAIRPSKQNHVNISGHSGD